jgi:hypothetical protein
MMMMIVIIIIIIIMLNNYSQILQNTKNMTNKLQATEECLLRPAVRQIKDTLL